MILVDVNLLLYAYNITSPRHARARSWLLGALEGVEDVALPGTVLLGFLRVGTNPRIYADAFSPDEAIRICDRLLAHPRVIRLQPGPRYWSIFCEIVHRTQSRGDLIMDVHLAALAIEHDATLCTNDSDFRRFDGLRVLTPLSA